MIVGFVDGHAEGIDPKTGTVKWTTTLHDGSVFFPLVSDGQYAYAVTLGGHALAFDPASGAVVWNAGLADQLDYYLNGTAAVDANKVYVGGVSGLFAFHK